MMDENIVFFSILQIPYKIDCIAMINPPIGQELIDSPTSILFLYSLTNLNKDNGVFVMC